MVSYHSNRRTTKTWRQLILKTFNWTPYYSIRLESGGAKARQQEHWLHLSIQKQEAENTLAHWGWSPEPSTGDSLLQQGSNGTGVLGAGGSLHLHGCCRLRAGSLLHGLPLKLPQHGFSHGCDQKNENPDQVPICHSSA